MTDPASYGFLPWVRGGIASLAQPQTGTNHLGAQVSLTVNTTAAAPVAVRLHGPGQVTGIDPRAIVRMEPPPNATGFEPNYFPAVEFAAPEFLWLFTPDVASGATLRPWLCLVVVREQPGVALASRPQALPILQFTAPAVPLEELPDLNQIAAWGHAQIIGSAATSGDVAKTALTGPSSARLSRLICPRRLAPSTAYIACLVPTYHAGVQVGLSPTLPVSDSDLAPAWDATVAAPFTLPVYASWRFSTGADGDFAALAQRMRPPSEPLDLGLRDMDVGTPGFGMPAFPGLTLGLEGALRSPDSVPSSWPAGTQDPFGQALQRILVPDPAPVPIITPPAYGAVPAGATLGATAPVWMRELNLDPRWRAAAGMGAGVVRAEQEALVASAWDQYEAVRRANQLLRQLQLARAVTAATRTRHLSGVDGPGTLLQLLRPLHPRIRLDPSSPLTLDAQMKNSRVGIGAVSSAFRRLARRGGPVGRRLFVPGTPSRIVERLNIVTGAAGALTVLTPRVPPQGVVLLDAVSPATTIADLSPTAVSRAPGWAVAATGTGPVLTKPASALPAATSPATAVPIGRTGGGLGPGAGDGPAGGPPRPIDTTPIAVIGKIGGVTLPNAPALPGDLATSKAMALRFRAAAGAVATYISTRTAQIADTPDNPPLATVLSLVQSLTLEAVDPAKTIVARARARLTLPTTGDPLRPLLGAPVFPQPMSRELAARQLLPGVDRVPPETAALLVTNAAFVEAYMTGLNDEMRRELAWRQYPVDQRATFFTHFWNAGAGARSGDDIPPIAAWTPTQHLGDNATVQGEQVVLLLRGELLRRYPNTIISLVQAQVGANNIRTLGTTELFPVFQGSIDPDMVFFGFALTEAAATAGAGWYFVLAEHPTEPRFGLNAAAAAGPVTTWNDLGWPTVAVAHNHVDLSAPAPAPSLEGVSWSANAAAQAFITFRRPVRLALHATALLG